MQVPVHSPENTHHIPVCLAPVLVMEHPSEVVEQQIALEVGIAHFAVVPPVLDQKAVVDLDLA